MHRIFDRSTFDQSNHLSYIDQIRARYPLTPVNSTLAVQDATVEEVKAFVGQLSVTYLEDGFSETNSLGAAAQWFYRSMFFSAGHELSALETLADHLIRLSVTINAVRGFSRVKEFPSSWPPIYAEIPGSESRIEGRSSARPENQQGWYTG